MSNAARIDPKCPGNMSLDISSCCFRQNPWQWQVFSATALLLNWRQMPQWELLIAVAPVCGDGSVGDKRKDGQSKGMYVGNLYGNSKLYVPWYTKFPAYFFSWDEESGLRSQFVIWIFQSLQKSWTSQCFLSGFYLWFQQNWMLII